MDPLRLFLLVMAALAVLILVVFCATSRLARIARDARAEGYLAWRKASVADLEAAAESEADAMTSAPPPEPRRAGLRIVSR